MLSFKRLIMIPATLLMAAAFTPANALTVDFITGGTTTTYVGANTVTVVGLQLGVWTINVEFAQSNSPGTNEGAFIHGTSSLSASGAGTLEIIVSDAFTAPLGAGSLTYNTGGSGTNAGIGTVTGYGSKLDREQQFIRTQDCVSSVTGGACTTSVSHGPLSGGFIMTMYQRINVTGATRPFSIDTDVYNVPEPGTLALLGLGLLGIGFSARRRSR